MEHYDIIIVGAGPAGLTAGLYTSRKGLKTLIIESKLPGGRAAEAYLVENYPGFPEGLPGANLIEKMVNHAKKFGVEIHELEEVIDFGISDGKKILRARTSEYSCDAVIFAVGAERKKLRVAGEEKLFGRGVSYCAICDAPLYKGRNMKLIMVGPGNEAAADALMLTDITDKVVLIPTSPDFEADKIHVDRLLHHGVQILSGYKVEEILEKEGGVVGGVKIKNFETGEIKDIAVDAVFIAMGAIPMTELVGKVGVKLEKNSIVVDNRQKTNIEGVFAAGDCTSNAGWQIVTAAGEGAIAAIEAHKYLKTLKKEKTG